MNNYIIKSTTTTNAESISFEVKGEVDIKGNLYKISYCNLEDGVLSKTTIFLLQNNTVRLSRKGATNYQVDLSLNKLSNFDINVSNYKLKASIFTNNLQVEYSANEINLNISYDLKIGENESKIKYVLKAIKE